MDDLPIPLSRVDLYLAVAAGMEGVTLPEKPLSRLEQFLAVIAGDTTVELPIPASLTELWLNYVAGGALTDEMKLVGAYWIGAQKVDVRFFAIAGGMEGVEAPQPQNRTEQYWARIAEIKPIHGVLKYVTGTSIALTDVVSGITSLENVYGDTFQQTYTGKNLLQNLQAGTSTTIGGGGISVTSNADGSITMTGTNLSSSRTWYVFNGTLVLPAGTYTYSGGISSTVRVFNDSFGFISDSKTITLTGSSTGNFSVAVEANASVNATIYPMIELGSTATSYEPYVGGTASPNPDYPQDIQVVTGEQTVNVHGKNYWNSWAENSGNIQVSEDGTMLVSGIPSSNGYCETGRKLSQMAPELRVGDTVYLYIDTDFYYGGYPRDLIYCGGNWNNGQSKTITETMLNSTVVVYGGYQTTSHLKIMVTKALETTYEPYQSQDYTVSLTSKNLFDKSNTSQLATGYYINTTASRFDAESGTASAFIPCQPNTTYTVSKTVSSRFVIGTTSILPAASVTVSSIITDNDKSSITILTPSDAKYLVVYYYRSASDSVPRQQLLDSIQIEQGSTATTYEPYYNYELAKIGTYQDYIYKSGDDWYVHKDITKLILNGTENWSTRTNSGGRLQVDAATTIAPIKSITSASQFCNYGVFKSSVFNWGSYGDFAVLDNTRHFILGVAEGTTADSFKAQVAANNIIVYCVLATATDTQITESTLIGQLNAINSAVLPKPNAYIEVTASGTNLAGALKISYMGEEE